MKRGLHHAAVLAGLVLAGATLSPAAASDDNVFRPRGAAAAPTASTDADLDALQLAGITAMGEERFFNFVDPRSHRSFWLPLNGSANGISVTSFDADHDSVVVQHGANTRTIKLRRSVIVAVAQPAPAAPPPIPANAAAAPPQQTQPGTSPSGYVTTGSAEIANPKTPQQIAQAETEARMLVSDLLEISMQERARQRALREGRQPPPQTQAQPQPLPLPPVQPAAAPQQQ